MWNVLFGAEDVVYRGFRGAFFGYFVEVKRLAGFRLKEIPITINKLLKEWPKLYVSQLYLFYTAV